MRKSRFTPTDSLEEWLELEIDLEIFKWNTNNRYIQYSSDDILTVGRGFPEEVEEYKKPWGFGFALDGELLEGTSSPWITFGDYTHGSASMNKISKKGDVFEVLNMEVWVRLMIWQDIINSFCNLFFFRWMFLWLILFQRLLHLALMYKKQRICRWDDFFANSIFE